MEELDATLVAVFSQEKKHRRFLIPLLQEVQARLGYLPREALRKVAAFLEIPPSTVWGVATFYNFFRLKPRGRHGVDVCMGTACHLAGGRLVLEAMARELDIDVGGITEDKKYSLDRVACVGCCALAPVAVVNGDVYSRMNPQKVEEVLVNIKSAEGNEKPPPVKG
ncbi:MAG TPA: NADH-quinone oxidoreductase subunit NuoE [Dehalococcoidia bacterium]|nr:NADH-quinone oxidoreductase subunit NuoE [Dehalococcoidia bacterium]